jgi:hypothetical protein
MGIRPLKLGGLSKDAVAQMLDGLSQRQAPQSLVSLIFEESQGNPFFVEEVYRHLIEDGKVFDEAGEFRTDIKIDEIDVLENVRLRPAAPPVRSQSARPAGPRFLHLPALSVGCRDSNLGASSNVPAYARHVG